MAEDQWIVESHDRDLLRSLAERHMQIAADPVNQRRRRRWLSHNSLRGGGPMILAETPGLRRSGEWVPQQQLGCRQEWARDVELHLRATIYQFEQIGDDSVVEPYFNIRPFFSDSGFGVQIVQHDASEGDKMGSRVWDSPIKDLDRDFHLLHPRTFTVERDKTVAWKTHLDHVFGDILPTRIRGSWWWTTGLTSRAIELIGLEQLMMAMYDNPQGLHRLMAFLRDDQLTVGDWLEKEGLLTLNNENDYVGSGSLGYSTELPQEDHRSGQPARQRDLWVLSESQETVGVGPDMFEEFIFPYQQPIVERYGLSYYGCCEPVHSRWHIIKRLPNLRKVSVSPWCDQAFMARELGTRYVFCRKPNPAQVSTDVFDEPAIRADLENTLRICKENGCTNVELVMKDVHTVRRQPQRLTRWVQLAREMAEAFA